jgi:sulfur relay (sulfurtransferase) complex TusBCD TusD component (DsrE family)
MGAPPLTPRSYIHCTASCAGTHRSIPFRASWTFPLDSNLLQQLAASGVAIAVCGTCMESRGLSEQVLIQGAHRSSMDELGDWVEECEKVFTF